ncbi:MAG: LPP20 family lipoprotein [Candidatus Calescibacterium sp.]|nr:LPP20 family lipoprotein [Candidatus Calescibacterium sp.]MCX7733374.1 LPP20 family lipoprotein [bacterium]MDW8087484.1 LPP20 family lipoprotein [Candidatus Calescibacterium sp.]
MIKKFYLFFLHVYALIPFACGGSSRPQWVYEPYKLYDPKRYIVGVGYGMNINQADDSARQEIFKQIRLQMKSKLEHRAKMEMGTGKQESFQMEEQVVGKIESMIEGEMAGIQLVQRYEDKKENIWYSLAILDKAEYSKKIRMRLSEKELEVTKMFKTVEEDIANGEVFRAISKLKDAKKRYAELEPEVALLSMLSGSLFPSFQEMINTKILNFSDILSIQVENEELIFSEPFTFVSIRVRVLTKDGKPAKNFPIVARFQDLLVGSDLFQSTDDKGLASFSSPIFVANRNRIEISSAMPEVKSTAYVYVSLRDKKYFKVSSESKAIQDFLASCLSKYGIELSSNPDYILQASPNVKVESAGKDFRGNPFYIVGISAEISVLKGGKETVFKTTKYGKGGGSSPRESLESAFRNLLSNMCKDVQHIPPDDYLIKLIQNR